MKIPDKALRILEQYKASQREKDDLVFSELKGVDFSDEFITKRTIAIKISSVDKWLRTKVAPAAEIDKKLTMHLTRHFFAQQATEIPIQILQKLYCHSSIITTMQYQSNFTTQQTDDALDKVLNVIEAKK